MQLSRIPGSIRAAMMVIAPAVLMASPAAAHWGHLADFGGHAHWAGLALGAAAAALAAGLAVAGRVSDEDEDTSLTSEDAQGEPGDA